MIVAESGASEPGHSTWSLKEMVYAGLAAILIVVLGAIQIGALMVVFGADPFAESASPLLAVGIMLLEGLIIIPAWVWGPGRHGGGWRRLGFRGFEPKYLLLVILAFVGIMAINGVWSLISSELDLSGQPDMLPMFGEGLSGLALALVLGAGVVPVAEEVFFRGFLYQGLRARWGVLWAVVASSLVFAAVHMIPSVLLPILLMSLLMTWVYERSGSLWTSILLHASINGLAFIAAYLAPSFA